MRISDWSSDVCSSDLHVDPGSPNYGQAMEQQHGTFGMTSARTLRLAKSSECGSRSEERRVGKSVSVRVDLGGRRIIKKKQLPIQIIVPQTYTKDLTHNIPHTYQLKHITTQHPP